MFIDEKNIKTFLSKNSKGNDYVEDLEIDVIIIFKRVTKKIS